MNHFRVFVLVVALAAAGCGESHDVPQDAQIVFDAFFPDTGPDAGPPPNPVGARCETDGECTRETFCEGLLGGYCTAACTNDEECPGDSICVQLSQTISRCLASCDPTSSDDQCQPGNGCTPGQPGLPPVCLPGCEADSDCGAGLECIAGAGGLGSGICIDPERPLGGACRVDEDCPPSAECATESSHFPGGMCIIFGCDAASNSGCPNDAQCLPTQFGGGICWDGCTDDTDCRPEYECVASGSFPSRRVCQPRFVDDNLGGVCTGDRAICPGGECLSEHFYGFPDSYCALPGCDPATNAGCSDNGICVSTSDGEGLCLLACDGAEDCRAGYACRPVSAVDPESPTACLPGCSDNSQCTAVWRDGTRNVCNPGTGYCGRPFNASSLGDPCADARQCVGGRCMSAGEGWPGGMCTYPGCRLSGEGPSATCPGTSVCTDDGTGDPELGVCVPSCTVDTSSCRTGYTCVPFEEEGTEGACRPAS